MKNGIVEFKNLYQGTYTIKEIECNENYIFEENEIEIELNFNENAEKIITNKFKKGNLQIIKIDADDNKLTLGGIEFDLINEEGDVVKHLVTDADGEAFIENINIGKYILKETKTKREYNLAVDNDLEVKWNETSKYTITNEKKKGRVEIYKTDEDDKNIKLDNVEFNILDEDKNLIEKLITNKNGYAISKELLEGKYYMQEIKTKDKYILDDTLIEIQIKNKETITYNLTNRKVKGKIKIIKISEEDNLIRRIKKNDPIKEVEFEIYDTNNNLIERLITNNEGIAISDKLEKGRYIVKEVKSTDYYFLNDQEYIVNIIEDGKIENITIKNTPHLPKTEIKKDGIDKAEAGEEIYYEFDIKNTGNVELKNFTWIEYIPFEQIKVTKLETGTYNEELNYKIYYKTNLNDYKLLDEINSKEEKFINLDNLNFENNDEKITELKIEYNTVDKGFKSTKEPKLYAILSKNLEVGETIKNRTRIEGMDFEYIVYDEDEFLTEIYKKEVTKKLPRTGE